jgi:hypothetical protein
MKRRLRVLVPAIALVLASFGLSPAAHAQVPVFWVVSYPQLDASGCTLLVARWSDNIFTWTPWRCPAGVIPLRDDTFVPAVRGFTQQALNGCVDLVTQWADGVYTWVPFSCPRGVPYVRPRPVPDVLPPVVGTLHFPFVPTGSLVVPPVSGASR